MDKKTFLEGPILKPLIIFTIPLILSFILQALYGAVDLIIVGKFGDTSSVAAVANGGQLMQTITGIITGFSTGVTVLIGQSIGAGDNERASKIIVGMVKILSIVSITIAGLLLIFCDQLVHLLNTPPEAIVQTKSYIQVCAIGIIFIAAYNAISGIFRGVGDAKSPLIFIAIACVVNIIGDLIFVAVLKMDATGAALATILAQGISVVFSIRHMRKGNLPFIPKREDFKKHGEIIQILKVGTPIAAQDCLTNMSFLIITGIINTMGVVASASLGISSKLFIFQAIVPMAFMSALSAFVAQNRGANQLDRAKKALGIALSISFSYGVLMFCITHFGGNYLALIFEKDPVVIQTTAEYLKTCSFEHFFVPLAFCFLGYFNGLGKTMFVMIQGITTAFIFRIPLSYLFAQLPESNMFYMGMPVAISASVGFLMCLTYFIVIERKSKIPKDNSATSIHNS